MEFAEDVTTVASSSTGECPTTAAAVAIKRKRTKRLRTPPSASSTTSSTDNNPASSTVTEEEEDMAHCLILLARGATAPPPPAAEEKFVSRKFTEAATTVGGVRAGFYVYECKTCNKCFPSFQALGGHRASHKRPKIAPAAAGEDNNSPADDTGIVTIASLPKPAAAVKPEGKQQGAARVHECSICGSEFSSGQALGGHMRRHRPILPAAAAAGEASNINKESLSTSSSGASRSNMLMSLDLNLPAPDDDDISPPHLAMPPVFSTALAVDCHY